jgi:hypothetical protein
MVLGEVVLEAHLALEVAEDRFDNQPDPGFGPLSGRALAEAVALGRDDLNVDEAHRVGVLAAPEALVGNQHAAGVGGGEVQGAVALLAGLGADEVIADRHALVIADEHQPHAPCELAR